MSEVSLHARLPSLLLLLPLSSSSPPITSFHFPPQRLLCDEFIKVQKKLLQSDRSFAGFKAAETFCSRAASSTCTQETTPSTAAASALACSPLLRRFRDTRGEGGKASV
ncbi:unnamed protein product [Pleuronectes platessa]|uniref:Secreted protein n=1 Tax=Pleuronectes platessa TaxID=8262 RepID=A0A9N7TTH0_PLEPL|nr:unnamed protein product [Pleuronectes platessa]